MVRIRISTNGKFASDQSFHAVYEKTNQSGSLDRKYVSKEANYRIIRDGYTYINQPRERIV